MTIETRESARIYHLRIRRERGPLIVRTVSLQKGSLHPALDTLVRVARIVPASLTIAILNCLNHQQS